MAIAHDGDQTACGVASDSMPIILPGPGRGLAGDAGPGAEEVAAEETPALPEFQGRGIGQRAVRALLELAGDQGRWGLVHAFPSITNAASNGICRSLGFRLEAEQDITFAGRVMRTNRWVIDPAADLAGPDLASCD
jgi:GNAT superfamily N-acetyltransferase